MNTRCFALILSLALQGVAAFVAPRHGLSLGVGAPAAPLRRTVPSAWKEDFAPGERDGSESGRRLNSAKMQKMREMQVGPLLINILNDDTAVTSGLMCGFAALGTPAQHFVAPWV